MRRIVLVGMLIGLAILKIDRRVLSANVDMAPLAYLDSNGNIDMIDIRSGQITVLTNAQTEQHYKNVRWSPDGAHFLAGVESNPASSANPPRFIMATSAQSFHFPDLRLRPDTSYTRLMGVWSPDGQDWAYVGSDDHGNHFVVSPMTGGVGQLIGTFAFYPCYGDGPGAPDEINLLAADSDSNPFTEPQFNFEWTAYGFLYTVRSENMGCAPGAALIDMQGKVIWQQDNMEIVALSPDRRQVIAQTHLQDHSQYVLVDVANGQSAPLPADLAGLTPKVWSPDGRTILLTGQQDNAKNPTQGSVSLWRADVKKGHPVHILTRVGYRIGTLALTPDGQGAAFSLITTAPFPDPKPGTVAEEVLHIEIVYIDFNSGQVIRLVLGSQPAFGSNLFTLVH
jgi:dipeptidyl aminopeptidase/acylaminoacyl peptidase